MFRNADNYCNTIHAGFMKRERKKLRQAARLIAEVMGSFQKEEQKLLEARASRRFVLIQGGASEKPSDIVDGVVDLTVLREPVDESE